MLTVTNFQFHHTVRNKTFFEITSLNCLYFHYHSQRLVCKFSQHSYGTSYLSHFIDAPDDYVNFKWGEMCRSHSVSDLSFYGPFHPSLFNILQPPFLYTRPES